MADNRTTLIKNTLILYLRMVFVLGCNLYITRLLLQALGVEDFGVYNVINAIVVLFSFFNTVMGTTVQRFIAFNLGNNNLQNVRSIFRMSLLIHIVLGGLILLVGETVGMYFLRTAINLPPGKLPIGEIIFHSVLIVFVIKLIYLTYISMLIAMEKVSVYATASIIDVVCRLGCAASLLWLSGNLLVLYSYMTVGVSVLILLFLGISCYSRFPICRSHIFFWDNSIGKEFLSFCGWTMLGAISNITVHQGINILLNIFFGVIYNAAMGIATQVSGGISNFVSSFQLAFRPQLIKRCAEGDQKAFFDLIAQTSKFSYYLLFMAVLPVLLNLDYLLDLWLDTVPDYTAAFCFWMIIFLLIDAVSASLWISVQALGDIRNYQIIISLTLFCVLPISYVLLKLDFSAVAVVITQCVVNFTTHIIRIIYLRRRIQFPVKKYLYETMFLVLLVTGCCLPLPYCGGLLAEGFVKVLITGVLSVICIPTFVWILGLNRGERLVIKKLVQNKLGGYLEKYYRNA